MAKFIIEVSDDYIQKRADVKNIIEANKNNLENGMVELVSFIKLSGDIEKGKNEFHISSEDFVDDIQVELFSHFMLELASTYLVGLTTDTKEEVKEANEVK